MTAGASYFTMEAYSGDQREAAWTQAFDRLALHPNRVDSGSRIHGCMRSLVSPLGISFVRVAASPQDFVGSRQNAQDGVWLALHLSGRAELATDSGSIEMLPGDIAFGRIRSQSGISFLSDFQEFFVTVPQDVVGKRLINPLSVHAAYTTGRSGAGRVFGALLASIADSMEKLGSEQLRPIEIALTEFLASGVAAQAPSGALRGTTGTQISILNRICQIIESRLGDDDLNLAAVAEAERISPRYVQKLFENAGDNFAHYVRLRRLERCRADLVNPLYAHLSITDICFRWGFNDAAHFSRAFREHYGTSPRAHRKQAGAALAKSAIAQIGRGWPEGADKALRKVTTGQSHEWDRPASRIPHPAKPMRRVAAVARAPEIFSTLPAPSEHHYLPANDKTVHWGYFSRSLPPILTIDSGDVVTIETLTHHANDDYARMIEGDPGAESVFEWTKRHKAVNRRGAGPLDGSIFGRGAGEGFGVHLCTGPIAVKGAEPGDVIEVRIRDVHPRYCANPDYSGRAFGSNAATWWGFHYKELMTEPKSREVVTIYEIDCSSGADYARATYNFQWTPQTDPSGIVHSIIDYPGVRVDHATIKKNYDVLKNVRIPLRPHFGVLALAPKEAEIVDSIPPSYFGGNLDNWRAGPGSSIYLPVSVPGGLFSVGDPHASQGDSELCGTAIECSLTGEFQLILHKRRDLAGRPLADLDYPLLETAQEWIVHGFSYANYLAELGDLAQSEIYKRSSLDPAMRDAFRKMRRLLMVSRGFSEDEAISLMSVAVDFGVTQVVDGNWCVHAVLRKSLFHGD